MSRPGELALVVVGSRLRGFKVAPAEKSHLRGLEPRIAVAENVFRKLLGVFDDFKM